MTDFLTEVAVRVGGLCLGVVLLLFLALLIPRRQRPAAPEREPEDAPGPPPRLCYVEVRFASPEDWERLVRAWALVGSMKGSETLDADADVWTGHVGPSQLGLLRDALTGIRAGEYELHPATRLDASTGRLRFDPWAFPYGGVSDLCSLAEAFHCQVLAYDDGTGRRAGRA